MNHRQVKIFVAIMRSGTTSRAAGRMGISKPAISGSLAELERAIGFSLFDRVRNRLVPTPEGKLFQQDVESYFRGIDTLRVVALIVATSQASYASA